MNSIIEIIGIYAVDYETDVHLIEISARVPADKLDVGMITQEMSGVSSDSWQVPWDERYLDERGQKIIGDESSVPMEGESTRLLFYFHFLNFDNGLRTPFGELKLSRAIPIPDRLRGLIKYQRPD